MWSRTAACYNTLHSERSHAQRVAYAVLTSEPMTHRPLILLLAVVLLAAPATAQLPATGAEVLLWTGPVPLATGTGPEDTPALTVYQPAPGTATGAAFVVLPGGGYRGRAAHEGEPVARWLASVGVTAFVARYRVSPYRHPAPLLDALRAIRYVRAHAREWGLDGRVGILGFSAGGHLASTAATQFTDGDGSAVDPVERASSRPDLAVLIYPVITFTDEAAVHKGSRTNLLGPDATPEQMAALSSERRVTARTPPVFLVHTTADAAVPPENSLLFVQALRAAGVELELHLYEGGRHGFGLGEKEGPIGTWPAIARLWLHRHGFATTGDPTTSMPVAVVVPPNRLRGSGPVGR